MGKIHHTARCGKARWSDGYEVARPFGIALGTIQVVAETGERNDWFASTRILVLSTASVSLLIVFIFLERARHHPVINLQLFRDSTLRPGQR
jgi:hypothetical protein